MVYRFGDCELDVDAVELRRGTGAVPVEPQVFAVLAYLIGHRGRAVPKEELLDEIWGDRFVSESALTSRIKSARQAVGDDGTAQQVIRTVHGRGYRFVADVVEVAEPSTNARVGGATTTTLQAFLFTDIERSVQAWNRDPGAMTDVVADHDSILRGALVACDGNIFKHTGDGMCATFTSPAAAVRAAVDAQRALHAHTWPEGLEPKVRMAVHLGEAVSREGDYFGPAVNKAARLLSVAHGGQVVLSGTVIDSAQAAWPEGVIAHDEGWVALDDFGATHVHQLAWEGLEALRPIRARRDTSTFGQVHKPLVGRDLEAEALRAELAEHGLVTIVGAGGVGKTHLAFHVAARSADDGWAPIICELAAVRDPSAVGKAVVSACGAVEQADADATESALRALEPRTALLVLDNCEHLRETVASLCARVQRRCPGVTVLATSRQRLAVAGEHVFALEPLDVDDAVAIFVDRSSALGSRIDGSDPVVARICERLDCIPLAVELASASSHLITPSDLEQLLTDRLSLLEAPGPDRPDHHRTLEAAIAWSYDELGDAHRTLLQRLSVFAGSFDLAAACSVGRVPDEPAAPVVRQVLDLCERSLVVGPSSEVGTGRYRLLESIRIFADSRSTDRRDARSRHVEHFLAVAERAGATSDPSQLDSQIGIIAVEWDNLRAAVEYAEALGDRTSMARLVNAVAAYAELTQSFEVIEWCERAVGSGCDDLDLFVARDCLATWSRLLSHRTDFERAGDLAGRAAALGESPSVSMALFWKAWSAGDFEAADEAVMKLRSQTAGTGNFYEAAHVVLRHFVAVVGGIDAGDSLARLEELATSGSETLRAFLELCRGMDVWMARRARDEAVLHFEQARILASQLGLWVIVGGAITNRSIVLAFDDDLDRVAHALRDGFREYVSNGMWTTTSADLPVVARLLSRVGDSRTAALLLGARKASNFQGGESTRMLDDEIATARRALPDEFDQLYDAGRRLTPPQAARAAIDALDELLDGQAGVLPSPTPDE